MSVLSSGGSECHETGRSRRRSAKAPSLSLSGRSQNAPWPRSMSSIARSVVGVGTMRRCYGRPVEGAACLVVHDRLERARDRARRLEAPAGDDPLRAGGASGYPSEAVGNGREELELTERERREPFPASRAKHELHEQ